MDCQVRFEGLNHEALVGQQVTMVSVGPEVLQTGVPSFRTS